LLQLINPGNIPFIAKEAIDKKMSVALLLERVEQANLPPQPFSQPAAPPRLDPNVLAAQTDLARILGCKVRISDRNGKGKIVIEYAGLEDFDRVLEMLTGQS
jgi:ParB family transcriptional regulator, chromosome partitioning protein